MKVLITGGCGFLGTNLASAALDRGWDLTVFDDLSRLGSERNLEWLRSRGADFRFQKGDVRERAAVDALVRGLRPDVVFHLAGQVAMTTSIADPRLDFETNVGGGINVLEAVRAHRPHAAVVYSSTNKVYGDLECLDLVEEATRYRFADPELDAHGLAEDVPLDFASPYGCSKGAVDQYMLDYARVFGLNTVVFRHSSFYGSRQFSTFDQGWIGWFVRQAIETLESPDREPFTISGDGKQVRDVLFVSDIVDCYMGAVEAIEATRGRVFNIGGGRANSLSLLELFSILEEELGVTLRRRALPWRQSDQRVFVADVRAAERAFGWSPKIDSRTGLRKMIQWVREAAVRA